MDRDPIGARLDAVARVPLADLPTPLEPAPRLARHAGLAELLVKRDDRTGLALGGNKARKLEYDLAHAVQGGCDVVITIGGAQSNHAAMTAAAARRLGLDVKLVLGGPDVTALRGNMLLDALFGAEIRYLVDDDDNDHLAAAMDAWVAELRAAGRRPCALPIGGSTGAGALGYVRAMRELAGQLPPGPLQLVTAVGSCGTLAGLVLGAALFLPAARIVGISVSRRADAIVRRTGELIDDAAALIDAAVPAAARRIEAYDEYAVEYGVATPAGLAALRAAAELEGLVLDPVYTGKTLAGLCDLVRRGVLDPAVRTVFLHTGGVPITFAFDDTLAAGARFTRIG